MQNYRAPNVFKSVVSTGTGNTPVWTPTSGKKFRLLRVWMDVTADAAAATAGPVTLSLLDNATQMGIARSAYVPATAGSSAAYQLFMDLGPDGIISATLNNVLNFTMSKALTSGTARIVVAGTEE